jgi:peptidoglycan/LPS O-acetylase OafA/YrhL
MRLAGSAKTRGAVSSHGADLEQSLSANLAKRPQNSIGALRLLFASLVIVSHSPEMLDGDSRRELLHRLFGTMSFGQLAVDAFFLISGYLIAASFAASASTLSYFVKRVLRIYPAFLVCSILCVLVVAPLGGAHLASLGLGEWARGLLRLVTFKMPEIRGAFARLPYPSLNGSAWTISYEFRCYILAAVFGLLGFYRRRGWFLVFTVLLLASNFLFLTPVGPVLNRAPGWFDALFGEPLQMLRLWSAFAVGTCFWLFKDRIVYRWPWAIAAVLPLAGLMFLPVTSEVSLILLGGYLLFTTAFASTWRPLHTINATEDISYGVYLYAWPVASLIIWYWRDVSPVILGLLTFVGAVILGGFSWFLIEKPAMNLRTRVRAGAGGSTVQAATPSQAPADAGAVAQGKQSS